jgi:glycosyltransferase involved in cell wall biosynthesis
MVGRLVAYKRFDVAIEAFNRSGLPLVIVGVGVEEKRLRAMARPNISFMGQVDDVKLSELYQNSHGVIFPQEEDFGIVPLEAMASGKPVIAYRAGGAQETVVDRITGIFFDVQTPEAIERAVERAIATKWLPTVCRGQAERFSVERFCEAMKSVMLET